MDTYKRSSPKSNRKRGPKPMDPHMVKASFVLPESLWDWATSQPERASELLRDLLIQERVRREAVSP